MFSSSPVVALIVLLSAAALQKTVTGESQYDGRLIVVGGKATSQYDVAFPIGEHRVVTTISHRSG